MAERFVLSKPIEDYISHIQPVDTGADSRVYKYGDYAIKQYSNLDFHTLSFYKDVTDRVIERFSGHGADTIFGPYTFRFVPIIRITQGANGQSYAICPYIDGDNLEKMIVERNIDISRAAVIMKECGKIGTKIDEALSVSGVSIIPLNVKLIKDSGSNGLYVTDLCGRINDLRSTKYNP